LESDINKFMVKDEGQGKKDFHEPLVSILVLNYNGKKFLKECFDSILKSTYSNYEIALVDNNSTDDSVAYTEAHYPMVRIVQTHKNGGYSRAYNIAFREAQGKYYILLNNDVVVAKNWLEPLVTVAETDDKIGALQPKIRSLIDYGYFEYAGACGGFMDKYGYPFLRGRIFYTIEQDEGQYDDEMSVFWTSGAAMFVRADALKKSGDLDEDFVHHMEEIDLCWRLHLVDYRLKVIPESVIYHYAGATIKADSFKKIYWNHRNGIFTLIKNLEKGNLAKILLVRYTLDVINVFHAAIGQLDFKHAYAVVKSHIWLLLHIPMIFRKRREVQKLRVVPDKEYQYLMYNKILVFDYFLRGKKTFKSLGFKINKED
jgi:GT2 family glycosyltransferase